MAHGDKGGKSAQAEQRRKRQAAELRANLLKRKEQARSRAEAPGAGDERRGRDEPKR